MEPDVEKGKKRRSRSARIYVNANKPLAVNVPEIAALFPPDEDDGGPAEKGGSMSTMGNPHPNNYAGNRVDDDGQAEDHDCRHRAVPSGKP